MPNSIKGKDGAKRNVLLSLIKQVLCCTPNLRGAFLFAPNVCAIASHFVARCFTGKFSNTINGITQESSPTPNRITFAASYCQRLPNRIMQQTQSTQAGVTVIRKIAPIKVIVYCPKTKEGKEELARRVSDVHAAAINQRLKSLNCPTSQKLALLDAVIETKKKKAGNVLD